MKDQSFYNALPNRPGLPGTPEPWPSNVIHTDELSIGQYEMANDAEDQSPDSPPSMPVAKKDCGCTDTAKKRGGCFLAGLVVGAVVTYLVIKKG